MGRYRAIIEVGSTLLKAKRSWTTFHILALKKYNGPEYRVSQMMEMRW